MNTTTFHKTLLAILVSGACASTLGADVSVRGDTDSNAQSTAQVQDNQAMASGSNQNSAAVQVSIDEKAVSNIRARMENSAQAGVALGGTVKDEAANQVQAVDGALSASVDNQSASDLSVSTLDGIAIDLSGSSDNSIAAQLNSTVDSTLAQSAESSANLGEAALGTTLNVLGNTAASVEEVGSAVDLSAAADSSTDAASSAQLDEASIGSLESTTDTNTTTSLVGGLL